MRKRRCAVALALMGRETLGVCLYVHTQAHLRARQPVLSHEDSSFDLFFSSSSTSSQGYKRKTEAAKKEYLKALAAYRASLVSKVTLRTRASAKADDGLDGKSLLMEWAGLTCSDVCWWVGDRMQKKEKKKRSWPCLEQYLISIVCRCWGSVVVMVTWLGEGSANRSKSARVNRTGEDVRKMMLSAD